MALAAAHSWQGYARHKVQPWGSRRDKCRIPEKRRCGVASMHEYGIELLRRDTKDGLWALPQLGLLEREIESSRYLLSLQDDDLEEGVTFSEATWSRATGFVRRFAKALFLSSGKILDPPRILPGPKGSIDIHWESDSYELLINIPPALHQPASFYGDNKGTRTIKGTFDSAEDAASAAAAPYLFLKDER